MTFSKAQQIGIKVKKKPKRIKQVSNKKSAVMRDRSRVLKLLKAERGNFCELKFVGDCTVFADGLHEQLKQAASAWRVGDYEAGRVIFLACNVCNGAIENEPERAIAEGFSVSRYDS